jgi:hypothetical protein
VTRNHTTGVRQHYTHNALVAAAVPPVQPSRPLPLDAIIVPASRPADRLKRAITLADATNCQLVLLCSRHAQPDKVSSLLEQYRFSNATVVDIPGNYRNDLFEFRTSGSLPASSAARDTDLSIKRNVGLAIARMLQWKRIFFLDDDISFSPIALRNTVSMLDEYSSVGMKVGHFPDNSVVCHAHRETGGPQDVLVSGSALAVDCTAPLAFFPDIYNEDWFFFYSNAADRELKFSGYLAQQIAYDPFENPERAEWQEFGDVLAEGMYALLDRGQEQAVGGDYWKQFLAARDNFHEAILTRIERARPKLQKKISQSVDAARKCLAEFSPDLCENYLDVWQDDVQQWKRRLQHLPTASSMTEALKRLGLAPTECSDLESAPPFVVTVPFDPRGAATSDPPVLMLSRLSTDNAYLALSAVIEDEAGPGSLTWRVRLVPRRLNAVAAHAADASREVLALASRIAVLSTAVLLLGQWRGSRALGSGRLPNRWTAIRLNRLRNSPGPAVTPTPPHAAAEMKRLP